MNLLDTFILVTATSLATALSFETAAEEEANENQNIQAQQGINPAPQQYRVRVKDVRRSNRNLGIKGAAYLSKNNQIVVVVEGNNEELFKEAFAATGQLLQKKKIFQLLAF